MAMSSQVRTVIELFCTILQQNNVSCIRAEMLRQAKYNKDSATSSMWKLLFDLITFCKSEDNKITPQNAKDEVVYVKTELQKFGYLSCRLSVLPPDMSSGSRELLLALGWLLHQQKVFDKIMSRRSDPLHQPLRNFVKLNVDSPEPLNTNALGDAIFKLPPRDAIQQQLMLCNKLHLACRRLHSFSQELRCLTHKIHQYTQGVSLQTELNHLTPLEVYLLRHPESLKQMMFELEKDNLELENLVSWKATEHVFWEWMKSVLNLHIQESAAIDKKISRTEEVHLPLPTNIAKEIVSIRSSLRKFILHHESEIERLDQLLLDKKITPSEIHVLASQVDSELTQLAGRLRHCGRGWDFTSDDMSSSDGTVTFIEPSSAVLSNGFSKKSRPKFTPQSEKGIKAVKLESLQQEVTKERQLLEQRIKQLETRLKQLQLDNLAKLQTCLVTDPNIICIQPRELKATKEQLADVRWWRTSKGLTRRGSTTMSRLRIGHTYITHSFVLKREGPPLCEYCDSCLTVERILIDCPRYQDIRGKFFRAHNLKTLFDDVDPGKVLGFFPGCGVVCDGLICEIVNI